MRTLVINSYAGSITLGARALGCDIIGSYEDSAYGIGIQKENFPELNYVDYLKDWPTQDLSETVVVAHPPCAAFSVQNTSRTARGVNSNAFACTKKVLDYAMGNKAVAIAIESVMGALGGAWDIHQQYADEHGYHLYRILENGCMFGAQWRDRFWSVWIRKGAASESWHMALEPRYLTVGEVVAGYTDGPSTGNIDRLLERQKRRLVEEAKLTQEEMDMLFNPGPSDKTQALGTYLWKMKYKKDDWTKVDVFQDFIGGFASGTLCYLGEHDLAPVLMGGSHWFYKGRNLSEDGYKMLMGFPPDYEFPETPKNYRSNMRTYLSKGVMPPIAEWIIRELTAHLGWDSAAHRSMDGVLGLLAEYDYAKSGEAYHLEARPNRITDFRIKKSEWGFSDMPPLRHTEERSGFRPPPPKAFVEITCDECTAGVPIEADGTHIMVSELDHQPLVKSCPKHVLETAKTLRAPKEPKPPRVPREPRAVNTGGRLAAIKVRSVTPEGLSSDLTGRRRRVMWDVISRLETPTHAEAITACIAHTECQILPTTAHWHLRQMIRGGQIIEVQ